jgi:hypothetical protein
VSDVFNQEVTNDTIRDAQAKTPYGEIEKKTYHAKLYRARHDPLVDMLGSSK